MSDPYKEFLKDNPFTHEITLPKSKSLIVGRGPTPEAAKEHAERQRVEVENYNRKLPNTLRVTTSKRDVPVFRKDAGYK